MGNNTGRGVQSAPKACLAKELRFFGRMKMKLRNRDVYSDLLRCMVMFSNEIITKAELEVRPPYSFPLPSTSPELTCLCLCYSVCPRTLILSGVACSRR